MDNPNTLGRRHSRVGRYRIPRTRACLPALRSVAATAIAAHARTLALPFVTQAENGRTTQKADELKLKLLV